MMVLSIGAFDGNNEMTDPWIDYVGPHLGSMPGSTRVSANDNPCDIGIVMSLNARLTTGALLQSLTDAAGAIGARVVVATSGAVDPRSIVPPSRGAVVSLLDLPHELRFLKVLVSHAGHGGVMHGIAAGVPLVCYPGRLDQPANAARVVEMGIGYCLGAVATKQEITATIECALAEGTEKGAMSEHAAASGSAMLNKVVSIVEAELMR